MSDTSTVSLTVAPEFVTEYNGTPEVFTLDSLVSNGSLLSDLVTSQLVSFELKDVVILGRSSVANVTVDLDYKAGLDNTQFRSVLPIADFVRDSLTNSQNPEDFYEVINKNVAE